MSTRRWRKPATPQMGSLRGEGRGLESYRIESDRIESDRPVSKFFERIYFENETIPNLVSRVDRESLLENKNNKIRISPEKKKKKENFSSKHEIL